MTAWVVALMLGIAGVSAAQAPPSYERGVPVAQTLDPESNLRAQQRMTTITSAPRLIVPGHGPAVFQRFERMAAEGVVRIR